MNVYVLISMRVGGMAPDKVLGVFEDLEDAKRFADTDYEAVLRKGFTKVKNHTCTFSWEHVEGVYRQRCLEEWDFRGVHHSVDLNDVFTIQPFTVAPKGWKPDTQQSE